jgi:hypothetical protein
VIFYLILAILALMMLWYGLGVGVASIWMCAEELASGALTEVLTDYALDPIVAFVVFPAGRRPHRKRASSQTILSKR